MTTHEVAAGARSATEVLTASRTLVDPALRAAVDTLPASMRRIAGYHFGWWDASGRAATADSGKALRPALTLLAAAAVGGTAEAAVPAAVAVELVHNFSLLHDDVMDRDETRRHRPTAWAVFGTSGAILAGDALLTLAFDMLAASGHPAAPTAMRSIGFAVQDLVEGQSADTSFEQRADVDLGECVRMAQGKTGALLGRSCEIGAVFGGAESARADHLRVFGERLGLAFQFVDDLLGIWGDPAVTGKPVYSDLRNRKKSLPVVAALTSGTPAGSDLAVLYHDERPPTEGDLVRAAELVALAGGRDFSRARADELVAEALAELAAARPAPGPAAELTALAHLATRRDH